MALDSELVQVARRELEAVGQLETVDGQLVVLLASQVAAEGVTGLSALLKELRAAMTRALERGAAAAAEEVEDEITRARRSRAEKRRSLGLDGGQR